jgi:hypothetical protein
MKTPECVAARKQLDEALGAKAPGDRLKGARENTALKCFGVKLPPPPESRSVPPPAAVEPIRLRPEAALPFQPRPPAQLPAAAPPPPAPPLAIPRAPALTSCDPGGCWDSDGTRYNQQGPVLLGPRGICTVQNGVLNCP